MMRGGAPAAAGTATGAAGEDVVQQIRMRDQGLPEVLNFLELLTGKALLRSQTLPALKVNFDSVGPMSKQEAILAIESLLALNGIAVMPVGDRFLKVVQTGEVAKQSPQFLSGAAGDLPASQQFYTKFFKLDYLDAVNEGQPIVMGLMSVAGKQDGNPVIFPKSNSIMVTDMLSNLQRIEQVLEKSDKPAQNPTDLTFFQLKHVKAADLKTRLGTLISGKDSAIGSAFTHNTTIEADERTNQLIVATHPSNLDLLRKLIEGLDGNVEPQTNSEVYYIKHADATVIGDLLLSVIDGQVKQREQAANSQNTANTAAGIGQGMPGQPGGVTESVSVAAAANAGGTVLTVADTRNLQFSDYVTIAADERANAIVAYGTRTDLTQIAHLIDKIDILLAQVNIQVIIAEVTLSDGFTNGIDQLTFGYDDGTWSGGITGFATDGVGGNQSPFSFTGTLDPKSFQMIIRNAKTRTDVRMLSAPVIVTTHNQEGVVKVTESRPILTSTVTDLSNAGTTSSSVDYKDIGIELIVTPLIGNNGIIQMKIEQRVDSVVGSTTINGNPQPIIGKREANSYVSVRDGEVVVLAGLQESSLSEKDNGLWLIGDIPLLGDLLNGRGKVSTRRELMIFIQPFVMTTNEQIASATASAIDNLDNARDVRTFLERRDMSDVTTVQALEPEDTDTPANRPINGSFRRNSGPRR